MAKTLGKRLILLGTTGVFAAALVAAPVQSVLKRRTKQAIAIPCRTAAKSTSASRPP